MRQLFFIRPGVLEWRDVPEPKLEGSGDAIVRPVAAASCDLDIAIIRGEAPFLGPFPLGHDFVAEVVEIAPDVTAVQKGDIVIVAGSISCGKCGRCRRGLTGDCAAVPFLSMYGIGALGGDWGGAVSDLVRVPYANAMLVPLPSNLGLIDVTSVGDNAADAWHTVGPYLDAAPEAPILIVGGAGGGSIGLYAVAIARALGSAQVDYVDYDSKRLEVAQSLGGSPIEGWPASLGPYPITVDASADKRGLWCAIRSTEGNGVCTSTGIYYAPETPLPLQEMYMKGITFKTGRIHARSLIPKMLELVSSGSFSSAKIVSEQSDWDDAPRAFCEYTTKLLLTRS
jgi:alcohol dehydrogenase